MGAEFYKVVITGVLVLASVFRVTLVYGHEYSDDTQMQMEWKRMNTMDAYIDIIRDAYKSIGKVRYGKRGGATKNFYQFRKRTKKPLRWGPKPEVRDKHLIE